jgi:hypothetical protein
MQVVILLLVGILVVSGTALRAEPIAKSEAVPVQAELLSEMSAHKLKVGAPVFARVTTEWHGIGCELKYGAILEGRVLTVAPYAKPERTSEVDLAFNKAQCFGREMGSFELLLAAVAAPPEEVYLGVISDPVPLGHDDSPASEGLSNLKSATYGTRYDVQFGQRNQFPTAHVHVGDVSGIRGLKLSVGAGPENSSILLQKGRDLWLEKHTLLLLVPSQGTYPRAIVKPDGAQPGAPAAAIQPAPALVAVKASTSEPIKAALIGPTISKPAPAEDIDLCAPPQCNVALPSGGAVDAGKPERTISIQRLGYAPRTQKAIESLDNDEALAYLGTHELLVSFNPHKLVPRHMLGPSGFTVRLIRAVLVDTETRQVTRTVDWELPDTGEYLWPLGDNTVLVHVASELRVYGEGMKIQKRISLDGPLAFVRVTPDGKFIAIGEVHERHTPELHARLKETLDNDPEEDVDVLVLNRNFDTVTQSTSRTSMLPPTLLNEGQAQLLALPGMRYRLSLLTWENNATTLARFESSCTPEFTSFAPDLIFLASCRTKALGREYRVLRPNGKLALRSDPSLNDCGQSAEGSANNETFVVKTVQSIMPIPTGAAFNAASFTSEELAVYRAADGKRLFGVRVGAPSSSRDNYALAPDGSQLAVLTREQISLYSVPLK